MLLPQTTKDGLETVKHRVETVIKERKLGKVCIGYAFYPEDGDNAQMLIQKAMVL